MNKLSKRLTVLSDLVDGKIVADVGCDHGKLVRHLFDEQKIDFAYVSDISQDSLNKAIILLQKYQGKFKAICCDGLTKYGDAKIDQCVIAGMGGFEILNIIDKSNVKIPSYVLSPQHDQIELKKYLVSHNFKITFDIIISDKGKFYNIIKCEKSKETSSYTEFDLMFGKSNFESPLSDIKDYIDYNLKMLYQIKNNQKTTDDKVEKNIRLFEKAKKELNYEQNTWISKIRLWVE